MREEWQHTGGAVYYSIFENAAKEPPSPTDLEKWEANADLPDDLAAEMGVLMVAVLGAVLVPAVRTALRSPLDASSLPLVGVLGGCSAMLAHTAVDFNLHIPANAIAFAVLLGLAQSLNHQVLEPLFKH